MGSIASLCSSALIRPLSVQLQSLTVSSATVIAFLSVTLAVASSVLFQRYRLPRSEKQLEWRLLLPFCLTTVLGCSLGCAVWSFNLVGLTAAFTALQVASCAPYAQENARIFYSLAFFDALYPLSVCALVFCKCCVADRLLRFNVASPSSSFVKGEKAIVALIVAASSIMVAGGIASATFFTIGARGWSDVSSSYTNATAECDPFDPKIATAAGIINKAFSIRSVVLWGEAVILTLLVAAFSIATHVCRARLTFLRQAVSNQQAVLVNRASLRITRTFMAVFISIIGRFLFAVTFATSTALGPYNPECGVCEDCQSPFFKLSQWLVLTPQIQVCADSMVVCFCLCSCVLPMVLYKLCFFYARQAVVVVISEPLAINVALFGLLPHLFPKAKLLQRIRSAYNHSRYGHSLAEVAET